MSLPLVRLKIKVFCMRKCNTAWATSHPHTGVKHTQMFTLKLQYKPKVLLLFFSPLYFFCCPFPFLFSPFTRSQIYYEEKWRCWQAGEQGSQEKPEVCRGEWRVKSSFPSTFKYIVDTFILAAVCYVFFVIVCPWLFFFHNFVLRGILIASSMSLSLLILLTTYIYISLVSQYLIVYDRQKKEILLRLYSTQIIRKDWEGSNLSCTLA